MDSVVHFEMPFDDAARISGFYQRAFGWTTQAMGPEMGNYVLAVTAESGPAGPVRPGAINGGFFPRQPERPDQHPSVVIAVQDIGASMDKVRAAGGEVLGQPMEIPGVGQYVAVHDTEGNRVSLLQPLPRP